MPLYKINPKLIIEDNYRKLEARVKVALFELSLSAPIRQSEFFVITGDKSKAIEQLIEFGFVQKNGDILEMSDSFADMFAKHDAYKYVKKSREKNKSVKVDAPKRGKIDCPYNEIVELYHTVLPQMPRVTTINKSRQKSIKARWDGILMQLRKRQADMIEKKKAEDLNFVPPEMTVEREKELVLNWFKRFFESILDQPFIMGLTEGSRSPFTVDQIMREDIFTKIIERAYSDKKGGLK